MSAPSLAKGFRPLLQQSRRLVPADAKTRFIAASAHATGAFRAAPRPFPAATSALPAALAAAANAPRARAFSSAPQSTAPKKKKKPAKKQLLPDSHLSEQATPQGWQEFLNAGLAFEAADGALAMETVYR